LVPGLFEAALQDSLELTRKLADRERLDVRFRVPDGALAKPTSTLSKMVQRLVEASILRPGADAEAAAEIVWRKEEAYAYLSRTPIPVNYLERAAKTFANSMETRRIRRSLHRLATRNKRP
jgi:hypothetical protein